jgi:hypothetical protein
MRLVRQAGKKQVKDHNLEDGHDRDHNLENGHSLLGHVLNDCV